MAQVEPLTLLSQYFLRTIKLLTLEHQDSDQQRTHSDLGARGLFEGTLAVRVVISKSYGFVTMFVVGM